MSKRLAKVAVAIAAVLIFVAVSSLMAAQSAPGSAHLEPYASCQFTDGLQVVQVDPLTPGVTSREVDTDAGPPRSTFKPVFA